MKLGHLSRTLVAFLFSHAVIITIIALSLLGGAKGQEKYRLCTAKEAMKDCEDMLSLVKDANITCIPTIDKISCIEKISKGEADIVPLEPEEVYVAHRFQPVGFKVVAEVRSQEFKDRDFRYEPVAIIRSSSGISSISDLQGKRSCHTGFGRNAGWKIPFSHLMDKNEIPKYCDEIKATTPEKDLYTISKYFGKVCAPGAWVPERDKDRELKSKYPNLCELCDDPTSCSPKDKYAGYEGALRCLTQKGDVAWTKMDAVIKFFQLDSNTPLPIVSEYRFLCWDGSSLPLSLNNTCSWAKRPWKAYLASTRLSPDAITQVQQAISRLRDEGVKKSQVTNSIPDWLIKILEVGNDSSTNFDVIFNIESHAAKRLTPIIYLDRGKNYSITIEKPSCASDKSIRFCVKSEIEEEKCESLQLAALGRRVLPSVACVLGESSLDCIKKVASGKADLVNLSPKDSDWAQQNYNLVPVLSELEDMQNPEGPAPYRYVLAVIKAIDGDLYKNVTNLRGKRSCHGSINTLAGWNAPIAKLRELGLIMGPTCSLTMEMSKFFGNQSCVPGAAEYADIKRMSWLPTKALCKICTGDGDRPGQPFTPESVCLDNVDERYYGPLGALRCLTDTGVGSSEKGVGDVAFMDHVGLFGIAIPSGEFKASTLKLICPNGSTTDTSSFLHCNWGKIPSNQILTNGDESNEIQREDVRLTLLKISDTLGPFGKVPNVMKMFGSYFGNSDLLFTDTSVGLCDFKDQPEFKNLIRDFDYCTTSSVSKLRTTFWSFIYITTTFVVIVKSHLL